MKDTVLMPLNGTMVTMERYYEAKRERIEAANRNPHRRLKRLVGVTVALAVAFAFLAVSI